METRRVQGCHGLHVRLSALHSQRAGRRPSSMLRGLPCHLDCGLGDSDVLSISRCSSCGGSSFWKILPTSDQIMQDAKQRGRNSSLETLLGVLRQPITVCSSYSPSGSSRLPPLRVDLKHAHVNHRQAPWTATHEVGMWSSIQHLVRKNSRLLDTVRGVTKARFED
jgi:hypothetical protein